jgi:hypothetical protein
VFDDWTVETIDLADFLWDPFGCKLEEGAHGSCRFVIHRTRRDTRYVLDRIAKGDWNTAAAQGARRGRREVAWPRASGATRSQPAQGRQGSRRTPNADGIHEILEFHHEDGRIITVLDKQIPVAMGRSPYRHGQMPFAVFRPATAGIPQLAGHRDHRTDGAAAPRALTLRSQRRDNAALVLAKVWGMDDGAIDINDLQFFPGAVIPTHGMPREAIYPLEVGDIPNSSYNEEDRIKQDIDRTAGISETMTGADTMSGGAAATATGVQLVQNAANVRINRQTRRLEVELVTRETGQAVSLNQQMAIRNQGSGRGSRTPEPGELGAGVRHQGPDPARACRGIS